LVESGGSDITISRLIRIAEFYGLELTDLVGGSLEQPKAIEVTRRGEGIALHSPSEGVDMTMLAHGDWGLSPVHSVYAPGGSVEVGRLRDHEVLFYVIKGTFEVSLGDGEPIRLRPGDAVAMHLDREHRITNVGKGAAEMVAVGMPVDESDSSGSR
jgi:quercetin dioxygenase-like cupin family protein